MRINGNEVDMTPLCDLSLTLAMLLVMIVARMESPSEQEVSTCPLVYGVQPEKAFTVVVEGDQFVVEGRKTIISDLVRSLDSAASGGTKDVVLEPSSDAVSHATIAEAARYLHEGGYAVYVATK